MSSCAFLFLISLVLSSTGQTLKLLPKYGEHSDLQEAFVLLLSLTRVLEVCCIKWHSETWSCQEKFHMLVKNTNESVFISTLSTAKVFFRKTKKKMRLLFFFWPSPLEIQLILPRPPWSFSNFLLLCIDLLRIHGFFLSNSSL